MLLVTLSSSDARLYEILEAALRYSIAIGLRDYIEVLLKTSYICQLLFRNAYFVVFTISIMLCE